VTLSEAVRTGILGDMTIEAARNRRKRDAEFPAPVSNSGRDHEYEIADLIAYASGQKREIECQS
jgi:hypothetical protein